MNDRTEALSAAGVSIWLDDLSRGRLTSGNLKQLIAERSVVGVTTNPTIFAAALSHGEDYATGLAQLKAAGTELDAAITALTTDDVRSACDLFTDVHRRSDGYDGRVSIEVDPRLAHDAERTLAQARTLWATVDRPNVLIKIPATVEGLRAITDAIACGISVNVTLIFSVERYGAVLDAYLSGLERAAADGIELSGIHSVASFFVSRVDTEVDQRLDAIGTPAATALKGKAALANARLAYELFEGTMGAERWHALAARGANVQRPLWASTGVKDPAYPDTMYVTELVADGVVNTMPEKTLEACADHGEVGGDTITGRYDEARAVFAQLAGVGVDLADVFATLETEGVAKFEKSWTELTQTVQVELDKA